MQLANRTRTAYGIINLENQLKKPGIDKIIAELKAQQKTDVEQRDYCIESLNNVKLDNEAATHKHNKQTQKIKALEEEIATLEQDIADLEADSAETAESAKQATSTRAKENTDFQRDLKDQRVTQEILNKALTKMQEKYDPEAIRLAMAQQPAAGGAHMVYEATATDIGSGPAAFSGKGDENNSAGMKVIAMLQTIIADTNKVEVELYESETNAQTAYQVFFQEANKSMEANANAITAKSSRLAEKKQIKISTEKAKRATEEEIVGIGNMFKNTHQECDFLLNNFSMRQKTRQQELDALANAKQILSGMS